MLIRPAQPEDAPRLADVHIRAWHETYRGIMPDKALDDLSIARSTEAWAKRLAALPDRHFVAVALDARQQIVGFVSAGPKRLPELPSDGEVHAINLVSEAKRQGVGVQLMRAAAQHLADSGFQSLGLWVLERTMAARAFYERLGGRVAARREEDFVGARLIELGIVWSSPAGLVRRTLATG